MNKLNKMIEIARRKMPPVPSIDFSYATNDELLELINDATTADKFHEIVYELVARAGRGELFRGDQIKDKNSVRSPEDAYQSNEYGCKWRNG